MPDMRKWKILLIHHSHTDIGYTERQEKIERFHVGFIKQAVDISEKIRSGQRPEWQGFRWTCETYWPVERFLEVASEAERQSFERAVRDGLIELSGTYLNMTELIDFDTLKSMMQRVITYGHTLGIKVNSAMTADINGYSWGYAQCLADVGIQNLFSCIHPHHGMFPLKRKQTPFWWETQNGNRILVWNGEHYMLGNDLGLVPKSVHSYNIKDEFKVQEIVENHFEFAHTRITRYLNRLAEEGYPYDFVPIMAAGLMTDNAPPNAEIMDFFNKWNAVHGEQIELQMTTLSSFFKLLSSHHQEIPVYRGDWPDWWSDGVGSTANYTSMFRQAQRELRSIKRLDPNNKWIDIDTIRSIEQDLMMYAEHTWGYSTSVTEPWNPLVQLLEARKTAYATSANRNVMKARDEILEKRGELQLMTNRPFRYEILNSLPYGQSNIASFHLDYWETPLFKHGIEVLDECSGEVVSHQIQNGNRGKTVYIQTDLEPGEGKSVIIRPASNRPISTTSSTQLIGSDGVADIYDERWDHVTIMKNHLETQFFKITWEENVGITSWFDKISKCDLLLANRQHNAFSPIYEVTSVSSKEEMATVRRDMGRNRKAISANRDVGRLVDVKEIAKGPLFGTVELGYQVMGTSYFSVLLTAYVDNPRVDVIVRLHKDSIWEPENFYIALPFSSGNEHETLWLEKTGGLVRPRVDQLPGTGTDYYCIQEGLVFAGDAAGLSIATPDTPLIQLGSLSHHDIVLHPGAHRQIEPLYSWVLNNFWETNFKATVGGFYEFRYFIRKDPEFSNPQKGIEWCHAANTGLISYRARG